MSLFSVCVAIMSQQNSFPKLNACNYASWRTYCKALLVTKGEWAAVNDPDGLTDKQKKEDVDGKALSTIILNVDPEAARLVGNAGTAQEAWELLKERYEKTCAAQAVQLRRCLVTMRKDVKDTLAQYFEKAQRIKCELDAAGRPVDGVEFKSCLLAGLTADYDSVVDSISEWVDSDEKSVVDLLTRLQVTEGRLRQRGRLGGVLGEALVGQQQSRQFNGHCWRCGAIGHRKFECPHEVNADEQPRGAEGVRRGNGRAALGMVDVELPALVF